MYEVWPGYYLKIYEDGTIRILFNKQPIVVDVEDYYKRLTNFSNLKEVKDEDENTMFLKKLDFDITKLTANEYQSMSISELEEVLKEMEKKEMYEKCAGILELINYKKETLDDGGSSL